METEEVVCVAIDIHKTKEGYEQSNSYITVFEIENLKENEDGKKESEVL